MKPITRYIDYLLAVAAVAAVVFSGLAYLRQDGKGEAPPQLPTLDVSTFLGRQLPPLQVLTDSGKLSTLAPARVSCGTLMVFFRSDCPYCEVSAPLWQRLALSNPVVAVSPEVHAAARNWIERHNLDVVQVGTPSDIRQMATEWGVTQVPITLVIGDRGAVTYAKIGQLLSSDTAAITSALRKESSCPMRS